MKDKDCRKRLNELARLLWAFTGDCTTPLVNSAGGSRLDSIDSDIRRLTKSVSDLYAFNKLLLEQLKLDLEYIETVPSHYEIKKRGKK